MEIIDTITKLGREIVDMLWDILRSFILWIPKFIAAAIILAIGIFIAKHVKIWLAKLLRKIKFDEYVEKFGINKFLGYVGVRLYMQRAVLWIFYWVIVLVFFQSAVDILDTSVVSKFSDLLFYFIPKVIVAIIIMIFGTAVANLSAKELAKFSNNYLYAKAVKVIIMFLTILTAVEQLGLNISFITDNLTVIMAGIMLAFGLAFGLGGKEKARDFLNRHFH